jgi:excisionase family DNA binding protein
VAGFLLESMAGFVGIRSRSTIYRLIGAGTLRSVTVGGSRLILRHDLLALLQNGAPL